MTNGQDFRDLVSGRRRRWTDAALRAALRLAETPYAAGMRLRNWRYDTGRAAIHRLPTPVISVGNLTLGGTGKTPFVEWLARWLLARGVRVALVSRGYGAPRGADRRPAGALQGARPGAEQCETPGAKPNDEARELAEKLPGAPHFQNPDRLLACRAAIAESAAETLVLDDGFQHRRVARDLDILLVDACEPFGFEHVFPRGTLREPLCGARRAGAIALTRRDMIPAGERERIRRRFEQLAPAAAWLEMRHRPASLRATGGQQLSLDALRGLPVAALCGIGNPGGFRHSLAATGCRIVGSREYPDHHAYSHRDLAELAAWADSLPVEAILCTHKDLVKLPLARLGAKPLWALVASAEIERGQAALEALLAPLVERVGRQRAAA